MVVQSVQVVSEELLTFPDIKKRIKNIFEKNPSASIKVKALQKGKLERDAWWTIIATTSKGRVVLLPTNKFLQHQKGFQGKPFQEEVSWQELFEGIEEYYFDSVKSNK